MTCLVELSTLQIGIRWFLRPSLTDSGRAHVGFMQPLPIINKVYRRRNHYVIHLAVELCNESLRHRVETCLSTRVPCSTLPPHGAPCGGMAGEGHYTPARRRHALPFSFLVMNGRAGHTERMSVGGGCNRDKKMRGGENVNALNGLNVD